MGILPFLFIITVVEPWWTSNADDGFQDIYQENFGCSLGDNLIHLPSGPNCPCGYYAVHQHKKLILKLSDEIKKPPYWRKGKLQFYICMKCTVCDTHKPVLSQCSPYNNTVCGSSCEEPYEDTNAGCFLLPRNSTSVNIGTTDVQLSSHSYESTPKTSSDDSLIFYYRQTHVCMKWEVTKISLALLVLITAMVILVTCIRCRDRWKTIRDRHTWRLTTCNRGKEQGNSNMQAYTNEREQLAGPPEEL